MPGRTPAARHPGGGRHRRAHSAPRPRRHRGPEDAPDAEVEAVQERPLDEGEFGVAESLPKAKNTRLAGLAEAGGEGAAAALVAKLGARAEVARDLAYRLYVIAERKKRAAEALSYNGLVQSWPEIARLAREGAQGPAQGEIFEAAGS